MKRIAFMAAGLLLAGSSLAQEAAPSPAAAPTRNCLPLGSLKGSRVVNGSTIDFTLRDGSVWRSNLARYCPGLATERAFSYQTSLSQLCAQDIIRVIVPISGQLSGASCGLGPFQRQPAKAKPTR